MKNLKKIFSFIAILLIVGINDGYGQLPVLKSVAYYESSTFPKIKGIDAGSELDEVLTDVDYVQLSVLNYQEESDLYVLLISGEDMENTLSFVPAALLREEERGDYKITYYKAWSLPGLSFPDRNNGVLMMLTIVTNSYDKIIQFEFYGLDKDYKLIISDLQLVDFDVF